jgi:hypothetical protein
MRFREIANPADQLALWKLISDKMWAAFEEPVPKRANTLLPLQRTAQGRAASPANRGAKAVPKVPRKSSVKAKPKAAKPRRAPMAPAPKPVPKPVADPKPQQLSPTQAAKQQTQQQQQLAQQLRKEITKTAPLQRIYPEPPTPAQKPTTPTAPMTNGYDERDKDELVIHSRAQQPFKTMSQTKSALTGQKSGF